MVHCWHVDLFSEWLWTQLHVVFQLQTQQRRALRLTVHCHLLCQWPVRKPWVPRLVFPPYHDVTPPVKCELRDQSDIDTLSAFAISGAMITSFSIHRYRYRDANLVILYWEVWLNFAKTDTYRCIFHHLHDLFVMPISDKMDVWMT